ncbi:MarR family winged helix-turn-helix transcriptional regulator [Alloscardovia criceti]|uniref:MarR family winged helix-turn-helix transcriptional regulator n=1 Tax=Alloscardovia criceti TaxID=356828 RepID=UPI00035F45DD|nr:MarR family transcriptional regulator [Alloscardovia criceti]
MQIKKLFANLMRLIHQLYVVFAAKFSRTTGNLMKTLAMLNDEGQMTAGKISEALDIKPSSVTQIINKLEQAGTVVREKSQEDSRVTFVQITQKGQELLKSRQAAADSLMDELFAGFSDEDIDKFNSYIEKLIDNSSQEGFRTHIHNVLSDDELIGLDRMSASFNRAREFMLAHSNFNPDDPESFLEFHRSAFAKWHTNMAAPLGMPHGARGSDTTDECSTTGETNSGSSRE